MDYQLLFNRYKSQHIGRKQTQQRLLYNCLREAILSGQLLAGAQLMGSRSLAQELKVARNTVLYAYEHLATEGLLQTRGRQTFVQHLAPIKAEAVIAPLNLAPVTLEPVTLRPAASALSPRAQCSQLQPDSSENLIAFMPGVPALAEFPIHVWRRYVERAWRQITYRQLDYGEAAGEPELRAAIAEHLTSTRGVRCSAEQVFITDGTQQSLDLCAHALASAGDCAWIENPGYTGAYQALKAAELNVRGIAVDEQGMAPSAEDWAQHSPKLIYLTPSHQFPLGSVMSVERRMALIESAKARGAIILEDDYDSECRRDGSPLPAMQGLVEDAPVVHLGTFSKTLFPALRIGFMVLPKGLVAPITAMMHDLFPRGRSADQLALAEFLRSGQFAIHLRKMRRLYAARRDALVAAIEKHLGDSVTICGGSSGIHITIELPESLVDADISKAAAAKNIAVPALSKLATGPVLRNGLMLGYAQVPEQDMERYILVLAGIIKRAMG